MIWKKECLELRKFAELERDAFQSIIDEMGGEISKKDDQIHELEDHINKFGDLQTNLTKENDRLSLENKELKDQYQNLIQKKLAEETLPQSQHFPPSSASSDQSQEILKMKEQIYKLRSQLRSSKFITQQLQGENELLKELELFNQKSSPVSLSATRSVLIVDESLSDPTRSYRAL